MPEPVGDAREWPAYWLVALEKAVTEGNHRAASQAQDELRRLGFEATLRIIPKAESKSPR